MRLSLPHALLLTAGLGFSTHLVAPAGTPAEFARTTIDLGVVVSDIEASAAFYKDVIGFTELEGFDVDEGFCGDCGLTDGLPLSIRVFALGEGESATKIKLMQVAGAEPKANDTAFIHSQLGFSYLSVFVEDTNAALARLAAAGVEPRGKGATLIGEDPAGAWLTLVADPDGNLIELIGPKK